MKILVVSYSLTGNNEAFASELAGLLGARQLRVREEGRRTMGRIAIDVLTGRTPRTGVTPPLAVEAGDFVLFVGPVWIGKMASPLRASCRSLRPLIGGYGFASVSGGAEGPNPGLARELEARLGRKPLVLVDLHIADLLPGAPRPDRAAASAYRLSGEEASRLAAAAAEKVRAALRA